MKVVNHRLCQDDGTPYSYRASPNVGGNVQHQYLVMHYTAGRDMDSSIRALTSSSLKASAHIVVGRDGSIAQLVPFDKQAWHAGASSWKGLTGLNAYSIGIELDNAGLLTRSGGGWVAWFGDFYPNDQVLEAAHKNEPNVVRGWQLYTPAQLFVALDVASTVVQHYNLKDVIGHDDIAPRRKIDPGPAFPLETFRSRLYGRESLEGADSEIYRTTANLNIRTGPGEGYQKLAISPLPKGIRVQVVNRRDEWREVEVLESVKGVRGVNGWLHGGYLTRSS